MTTLLEALRTRILTDTTLSSTFDSRVRPVQAAQTDSLPYAVMFLVGGREEEHLGGDAGLEHAMVQIDVLSDTQSQADTLSKAIKDQLVGYRGTIGTITVTGISRSGTARHEEYQDADGSDDRTYLTSQDYIVSHRY